MEVSHLRQEKMTLIKIRAKKVKEFVSKYNNKGKGIKDAIKHFGYSRATIYNYLKM